MHSTFQMKPVRPQLDSMHRQMPVQKAKGLPIRAFVAIPFGMRGPLKSGIGTKQMIGSCVHSLVQKVHGFCNNLEQSGHVSSVFNGAVLGSRI